MFRLNLATNAFNCILSAQLKYGLFITILLHTIGLTTILVESTTVSSTSASVVVNGIVASSTSPPNCANVRPLFESRGMNATDIPTNPVNGKCCFLHIYLFKQLL